MSSDYLFDFVSKVANDHHKMTRAMSQAQSSYDNMSPSDNSIDEDEFIDEQDIDVEVDEDEQEFQEPEYK